MLELLQVQAEAHSRELEGLIQLLSERSMYEDCYAAGLDKVAAAQVKFDGQVAIFVAEIKAECVAKAARIREFAAFVEKNTVKELRNRLKCYRNAVKELGNRITAEQTRFGDYKAALNSAETTYFQQFRKAEKSLIHSELPSKSGSFSQNRKLSTSLRQFQDCIETYNLYLPQHQANLTEITGQFSDLEGKTDTEIEDLLRKMHEKGVENWGNMQKEAEERSEIYTQTEIVPAKKLIWSESLVSLQPYSLFRPAPNDLKAEMETLVCKAWSDILSSQELAQFRELVSQESGRKVWVSCLNAHRALGEFRLNYAGFCGLAEMMNVVLDECDSEGDIVTAKKCLILSQTFYHGDTEKVFIQSKIMGHSLWRKPQTWEAVILHAIAQEVQTQKDCGCTELAADQQSIIFAQLSSFAHIMWLFGVDTDLSDAVLRKLGAKYKLSAEEMSLWTSK